MGDAESMGSKGVSEVSSRAEGCVRSSGEVRSVGDVRFRGEVWPCRECGKVLVLNSSGREVMCGEFSGCTSRCVCFVVTMNATVGFDLDKMGVEMGPGSG
jgi:hypothetical protein